MDLVFPTQSRKTYSNNIIGIELPVILTVSSNQSVRLLAKLDTGASFCIFQRVYAEQLGLDVESGNRQSIATPTGRFDAFGHRIRVQSFEHEVESVVYFAADDNFSRNVLGRTGWLDRFRLGLVDYDCALYLRPYDDAG